MAASWFEQNPKKTLVTIWLLILLGIELAVRVLANAGLVQIVYFPVEDVTRKFYGDINADFGVWHYPNKETRHISPCFDVSYESNSYGARDLERARESHAKHRAVVLGDSFVEGVGVNLEDRMTNVVETLTGVEQLNFGVSGDFSSTQEWLLYENLASSFEHTEISIFFLPDNDFKDNDPANFPQNRYRPYLKESPDSDDFELYYPVSFEERMKPTDLSPSKKFRRQLYNSFYTLNVIRRIGQIYNQARRTDIDTDEDGLTSSYDHFSKLDLERLLYGYRQLIHHAGDRPVRIFIIPRLSEFIKFEKVGYNFRIVEELSGFANEFDNVEVIDLLPEFVEIMDERGISPAKLFLRCDGHWSVLGNRLAAEIVASKLYRHKPKSARFAALL